MKRFYVAEKISEHIGETPEGFLICYDVPIAKIGEQTYKGDEVPIEPNRDGLVLIKRTEDEVFKPEAISSFEGKPFTIDHPDEIVTPENWGDLAHGFLTNVRRGAREKLDLLIGDIVVTTKKAIELVKNGMREISCGYDADYEQLETGIGIQKNIIGNHIALVMRGRAGHRCAIGDKACTNCGKCTCNNTNDKEEKDAMKFKDKLKKAYRRLIKDDDFVELSEEEKADKLVEVASDQIEEEAGNSSSEEAIIPKEGEEIAKEPVNQGVSESEVTIGMLNNNINRLIGIIEAFVKSASGVAGDADTVNTEEVLEKENKAFENDAEGTGALSPLGGSLIRKSFVVNSENEEIEKKKEDETEDEDPDEKEEREKEEAMTADSMFHDVAYRADLLCPGIRISKPTKDHLNSLDKIKRKALKAAFTSDADVVGSIIKKTDIDKLDRTSLGIAFVAVTNSVKDRNNRFVKDSVISNTAESVSSIRDINQKNKEFWKRK
jgi:hypothetical protein